MINRLLIILTFPLFSLNLFSLDSYSCQSPGGINAILTVIENSDIEYADVALMIKTGAVPKIIAQKLKRKTKSGYNFLLGFLGSDDKAPVFELFNLNEENFNGLYILNLFESEHLAETWFECTKDDQI